MECKINGVAHKKVNKKDDPKINFIKCMNFYGGGPMKSRKYTK